MTGEERAPEPTTTRRAAQPSVQLAPTTTSSTAMPLEGERRLATVILADVVRSTNILERVGTEKWVHMMNRVLQSLEAEVYRFGGVVDQFRGDGLVAFFGAVATHEDDPERGVLAALAMHHVIEPYALELAEQEDIELTLRVGVNTGEVIVANIGDQRHHSEDTAMGEAVTLAARMEAAAEPGTVLVSERTFRLVELRFDWMPLGTLSAKGVRDPVAVYRPLRHRTGTKSFKHLQTHELSALLTGREEEFEAINSEIDRLRAGRGGIVMLKGETGMGKSVLVANLHQNVLRDDALLTKARTGSSLASSSLSPSLTWLQGRCRSYDQMWPYSLWLEVLRSWLEVRDGEPREQTRERLQRESDNLWGDESPAYFPTLAEFLSLEMEEGESAATQQLDAEARRQRLFVTIRSWVEALARRAPVVVALEDMHWADVSSLELLEYCVPICDHAPLLWLAVFRQDRLSPIWDFQHWIETEYPHRLCNLTVSPLTDRQARKMIDRLIGPDVLPTETSALLLEKSEGNPYYVEEFIHALMREGVLVRDEQKGQWRATRAVVSLDLPESLQNLLLARIDRLQPDERRVLQMAAVIGSVFWSEVLGSLAGDVDLRPGLTALQRAQLIHQQGRVRDLGMAYAFESNLIRDAAYDSLLSAQRVNYHRLAAESLERIFAEKTLKRYYSLLAYHYRCAGATRKELFYTLLAAEEAQSVFANVEALEYYGRALQILGQVEEKTKDEGQLHAIRTQRFEVLNGRREVYYRMGDFALGWADAQELLPLAEQLREDPVWRIDALLQQPGVGFYRNEEEVIEGARYAEEALQLAKQLGDRRREMQSLTALAGQRFFLNDPSWQELGQRALDLARQLGDKRAEAMILTGIGSVYASSDPERSTEYLEAALPIIQEIDDKLAEIELLSVIGIQLESSGDYCRRLNECHEKQVEISREIGHRPAQGRALMFYGQIQSLYLGDFERGLENLEESRRLWEGTPAEIFPLLRIAQVRVAQSRFADALDVLERVRRFDDKDMLDLAKVGRSLVSALVRNALGDEAHLREALDFTSHSYNLSAENPQLSQQYQMVAACESAAAHLGLAQVVNADAEREHHLHLAVEASRMALDIYESFGFVRPIECVAEEILFRRALALQANGDDEQGRTYVLRAYEEMMRKHALIPEDSPYRRTFLENIPLHRRILEAATPLL